MIFVKRDKVYDPKLSSEEKIVLKSLRTHMKLMGLGKWDITLDFLEVVDDDMTPCQVVVEAKYFKATIEFFMDNVNMSDIDMHIRHELFHVLIWWFFEISGDLSYKNAKAALEKLEERTVTELEMMPMWGLVYEKLPANYASDIAIDSPSGRLSKL